MSTITYKKLITELSQEITLSGGERYSIGSVIPGLFYYGSPAGTFTLTIESSITHASKSFTVSDIKSSLESSDDYGYLFYPVIFDNPTQLDSGNYTVKITASGYTPMTSSFIGWIQQYENLNNQLDYTPSNDSENPLSLRLKVLKRYS